MSESVPESESATGDVAAGGTASEPSGAASASVQISVDLPRQLKVPPHSVEAEQCVLGGLMLNNDAWFNVADTVVAGDFYRPQHKIIFEAISRLADDNQPLDAVTLSEALSNRGLLEKAGGIPYLAELVEDTPGASNVVAYAGIVRERSTLRQLIAAANKIAQAAFRPEGRPSAELLDMAESEVFRIQEARSRDGGPQPVIPLLTSAVERIEKLYESRSPITGLPTGFDDLDKKTAGLHPSDLIIVAGRPSMGKTSLAMNMVEHALLGDEGDGAVLVFSLEMPAEQIIMRMLSSLGRIDQSRMRTGNMHDDDWPRFTSAVSQLKDKNFFIDDTPAITPNEMRTRARRVARENGGLRLIVVDYLQLMRSNERADNRTGEISEISRSLKALAKDMKCPLIAASQLNRALESRPDKRPLMSDLRESGAIEQDADLILFIYRDEVYNPESVDKGIAEINIGKQRNGPIGRIRLKFMDSLTKFENLEQGDYSNYIS